MIDGIIAMFVMVLLLLGLSSLLLAARVNAKIATENNTAYNAARQIIENVRLYRGVPLTPRNYSTAEVLRLGAVPQLNNLSTPDIVMNLAPWTDPDTSNARKKIMQVRVTITWRALGGTNTTKSRTLVSLVTPNGVVQ